MIDETDWPLLARYFAGECSAEEAAETRRWLDADPERRELVAALREVWDESGRRARAAAGREELDLPAAWDAVLARKRARERARREFTLPSRSATARVLTRIAAAIVLLAGGALVWRAARLDRPAIEAPLAMREIVTPRGQRAELRLSDGTRVVLGVDSKLRFAERFEAGSREVHLEGEAYFEVTHDERRPFLVHAGGTVSEDLGTEFTVRAYAEDRQVQVVVAEGKVGLHAEADLTRNRTGGVTAPAAAILTPGQLGRLDPTTRHAEVLDVDPAAYIAWVHGRLVFDDTPLPQVLAQLERWYDVEFRLEDSALTARPLTASFQDESIVEVLEVIAPSLDIRYRRDGRTITLTPRK